MRILPLYPWSLATWKHGFRQSGISGIAMLLLILGGLLSISVDNSDISTNTSSTGLLLLRGPLLLLCFILILTNFTFSKIKFSELKFLLFLQVLLFILSTIWSGFPLVTFGKSMELVACLLIIYQASRSPNPLQRLEGIYYLILILISTLVFTAATGYLLGLSNFTWPRPNLIAGSSSRLPFLSTNGVGYASSCLILVTLAINRTRRKFSAHGIIQLFFFSCIFLTSSSRTSLGILFAGVFVLLLRKSLISVFIFLFLICSFFLILPYWSLQVFLQGHDLRQFSRLSGRVDMWEAAFSSWQDKPLLGFGGGVGGKSILPDFQDSLSQISSLHSGIFESLTGTGMIGLLLGLITLIIVTSRTITCWKKYPQMGSLWILIVFFWINSIMSLGVLAWMNYTLALYYVHVAFLDSLELEGQ